jgi:hypothetical protein
MAPPPKGRRVRILARRTHHESFQLAAPNIPYRAHRPNVSARAKAPGFGMENEIVLLTTIPAGEVGSVYGRESWVSV